MNRLFTLAIALAIAPAAQAQDWTPADEAVLGPQYHRCMDGDDARSGVTPAMMACQNAEYVRQDARLNRVWRAVMTRRSATEKASLRADQRRWIARRDATCQKVWDEAGGGEASDLNQSGCLLLETIRRTAWLERR